MNYTIDLTKGDAVDFTGVFEETKTGNLPITNEQNQAVSLTGATLSFAAHKGLSGEEYAGGNPFTISGGVLWYDFTAMGKGKWYYELKVTLAGGFVFKLAGNILFK